MANFLRYVDTDVAPGGVGSIGDPYASLNEADADMATITGEWSSGDTLTVHCVGATADSTATTFDLSAWSAGSGLSLNIEGNNTTGKYDTNYYHFSGWANYGHSINVKYATALLKISKVFCDSGGAPRRGFSFYKSYANAVLIEDCYIGNAQLNTSIAAIGIDRCANVLVVNSILHTFGYGVSVSTYSTSSPVFINCIINNCITGARFNGATTNLLTFTNCAVFNNTDDFDKANGSWDIDHCASDDGDGTNAITGLTWADEFTDYTNGDFSLVSGSNLIGAGATGTGVTEDITGAPRPSPPSVGAFEYISGGGGTTLTIADVGQPQGVDVTALDHHSPITLADIVQGQSLDAVPVAQSSPLTTADVDQGQSINSSVLTQLHGLTTATINQPQTIQQLSLAIAGGLTIANIDQGQGITTATLAQASQVIAANIGQAQAVDSSNIDQLHTLITSAVDQAQSLDAISLIVPGGLTIASINQTQTVDSINASQLAQLVLDNINQAQTVDAVVVAVPGSPITIANIGQAQTVSQVVAGQITGLLVDGIDQGQSINNINFSIANGRLIIEFTGRAPEVSFEARIPEIKFS